MWIELSFHRMRFVAGRLESLMEGEEEIQRRSFLSHFLQNYRNQRGSFIHYGPDYQPVFRYLRRLKGVTSSKTAGKRRIRTIGLKHKNQPVQLIQYHTENFFFRFCYSPSLSLPHRLSLSFSPFQKYKFICCNLQKYK